MTMWHVSRDGQQREPMTLDALRMAVQLNDILPTDLAWTEGMAEWQALAAIPQLAVLFPAPVEAAAPVSVVNYQRPASEGPIVCTEAALRSLRLTRPWVRLIAIVMFVIAGLILVGILFLIGAAALASRSGPRGMEAFLIALLYGIFALVYGVLGLYLNRFASSITGVLTFRREDQLEKAFEAQRKFWRLVGVMFITAVGLYVVALAGVVVFAMFRR